MIRILCLLFLLVPVSISFSGQYYKWYDENGVAHIGDQPPRNSTENTETIILQDSTDAPSRNIPANQRNFDQSRPKQNKPRDKARKKYDRNLKKCKEKVLELMKKAEKAKYRAGSERFIKLARIQSDLCYGRSSPKIEKRATGPLNQISKHNYVDADGNVWHCPGVMGRRTINIDEDCTPQ